MKDIQRNGQSGYTHTLSISFCVSCSVVTMAKHAGNILVPQLGYFTPAKHFRSVLSAAAEILVQDYLVFDMTDPNNLFS